MTWCCVALLAGFTLHSRLVNDNWNTNEDGVAIDSADNKLSIVRIKEYLKGVCVHEMFTAANKDKTADSEDQLFCPKIASEKVTQIQACYCYCDCVLLVH